MTTLTVERLRLIREAIDAALAKVAKDHDLATLRTGPCSYDREGSFNFKVEGVASGGKTKEASRYELLIHPGVENPLPPLGWDFMNRGERFIVTGCNTTGTKVHGERVGDGKVYLFNTDWIRTAYARERDAARRKPVDVTAADRRAPGNS